MTTCDRYINRATAYRFSRRATKRPADSCPVGGTEWSLVLGFVDTHYTRAYAPDSVGRCRSRQCFDALAGALEGPKIR